MNCVELIEQSREQMVQFWFVLAPIPHSKQIELNVTAQRNSVSTCDASHLSKRE
jgi:hypothetical protein